MQDARVVVHRARVLERTAVSFGVDPWSKLAFENRGRLPVRSSAASSSNPRTMTRFRRMRNALVHPARCAGRRYLEPAPSRVRFGGTSFARNSGVQTKELAELERWLAASLVHAALGAIIASGSLDARAPRATRCVVGLALRLIAATLISPFLIEVDAS